MPFNALGGELDAIWERFDENGKPSISKLTTRLCQLNPDLFDCLLDPAFRLSARRVMIAAYFTPAEQVGLCERLRIPVPDTTTGYIVRLTSTSTPDSVRIRCTSNGIGKSTGFEPLDSLRCRVF